MTRPTTKEEARDIKQNIHSQMYPKRDKDVHFVWHKFQKDVLNKAEIGGQKNNLAFMNKCEQFAKRFPQDVFISRCDDSMHMGSRLVLIHHKSKIGWMGVSVIIITQAGDKPIQFFLYGQHNNELIQHLTQAKKEEKTLRAAGKRYKRNIPIHPTLKIRMDI